MIRQEELTRVTNLLTLVFALFLTAESHGQILGPSVQEVKYQYTTTFEIPVDADEETDEDRAFMHASHLFGIFHSPRMVSRFSIPKGTGGIGAPRSQMRIRILSSEVDGDIVRVKYSNSGKMVLHKLAAKKLIEAGEFLLPMPTNPYEIYDEKCTDEHYTSFGDYWYFYDPYKRGCNYLLKAPMATEVRLSIKPAEYKKVQTRVQLPQVRGDNGNGSLFSIYVIHGYESDPKNKKDSGRENFNEFNKYLKENKFIEDRQRANRNSSLHIYTKNVTLDNNKEIVVEVKHMLVETAIESRSKVFAKFFKEAIETADLIVYGGHSGLGGNLDIPSLEEKAGAFKFNPKKKQIFYFDSCSSYSYYLEHFAVEKTKAKIDVVTNGLSSYFHTSPAVLGAFMDRMLTEETQDAEWSEVLNEMEDVLDGDTYLLNVGGI